MPFILHSYLSGVSTAKLFAAGIIPGLFIAFLLMFYCYRVAVTGKVKCPAPERFSFARLVKSFKNSYLAVLAPVIILVGMLSGVVTPTETGIVAVTYCTIVGFVYKDLRLKDLPQIIRDSVLSTALIMFLVGTGSIMGWIVSVERLPALVSAGLLSITTNKYLLLFLINVIVLALGCVMEGIPIKMFLLPILIPILNQVGVDQVHFGVVMTIGTLLGMLTPPVGLGLYVMTTISNLTFEETIQAVLPFYGALLLALFILTYVPAITLWLPNLLFG
ncbi:MAG TPA: TRAP transporter large permease [Firmicutes bacterium]|nr:TRAP transporter large permease [Bacillota bacterium]